MEISKEALVTLANAFHSIGAVFDDFAKKSSEAAMSVNDAMQPITMRIATFDGKKFIIPAVPCQYAIVRYPGGDMHFGPTNSEKAINDAAKRFSPEAIRFVYRTTEDAPWAEMRKHDGSA